MTSFKPITQIQPHIEHDINRLPALRVSKASGKKLEQAYKAEHAETLTHSEWVARNLKIHYLLAEMCGNRFYEALLTPLLDLTREMVLVVKPGHTVIHDHKEHEAIAKAVAARDPKAASTAMGKHISQVGASLIELEAQYRKKKESRFIPSKFVRKNIFRFIIALTRQLNTSFRHPPRSFKSEIWPEIISCMILMQTIMGYRPHQLI